MNTKKQLIEHLKNETGVLEDREIEEAFSQIDRNDFVPKDYECEAYEDYALPIGFGQTISQPTTVAFMLNLLEVEAGSKVLDVGSGSGYTTAILAALAKEGSVLGIEIVPELAKSGEENLKKYKFKNTKIENRSSKTFEKNGPRFDRILVNAAAPEIPPNLFEILSPKGILVIPVGHSLFKITKNPEGFPVSQEFPGFSFVPLK